MTVDARVLVLVLLIAALAIGWHRTRSAEARFSMQWRTPSVLFLGVAFVYLLNGRALTAGDTIPASYLPLSLVRELDFDFDEFPFLYEGEVPWFLQRIDGRIVSAYPPWAGVLALPIFLIPILAGLPPESAWVRDLEKLSATLMTALSVVLLLFTLRRLTDERTARYIAVAYAFGTSSFSISSQALWQHGPSQLFLTLTIYCLVRGIDTPRFAALAGLPLGMTIICRPSNVLMAIPIAAYVLFERRAQFAGFGLASLPPLAAFMVYNMRYHGSPVSTGFAAGTLDPSRLWGVGSNLFQTPLLEGLAGVLVSPGRGLFVYSPILLLSVVGVLMLRSEPRQVLLKYLGWAALMNVLLAAKWGIWWGGGSYGPRLLADIAPILSLCLYLPLERARSRAFLESGIAGLFVISVGLHALGVFGSGDWNRHPNINRHPERLWSWRDSPPIYYAESLLMNTSAQLRWRPLSLPTSRDATGGLAASYELLNIDPEPPLHAGQFALYRIRLSNTGHTVWLHRTREEKGDVIVEWRWLHAGQEVPSSRGEWILRYDVLPGQPYDLTLEIAAPPKPGEHLLQIGLAIANVTSFRELGTAPMLITVDVADVARANP